jgi:hypothetical protein
MKPRLFIGSSTESLEIANAVQANLDHDATITIWNQGVFNLSSETLNDLLNALDKFDFAIFIFKPNDVSIIRNQHVSTVRDNVIFELGLFLGRLGKERVFYLKDKSIKDLHLPTDLIGFASGTYDGQREDGNLQAALGPFCFEVSKRLKNYIYENLNDLQGESLIVKKIAAEKAPYWGFNLAIELLNSKLLPINASITELNNDMIVQRKKSINYKDLYRFVKDSLATITSMTDQFLKAILELNDSVVKSTVDGNALEIKKSIEHMILICKELLSWEYDLHSLNLPNDLAEVKLLMQGTSQIFISNVNDIVPQLTKFVVDHKAGIKPTLITFNMSIPEGLHKIKDVFFKYLIDNKITDFEI